MVKDLAQRRRAAEIGGGLIGYSRKDFDAVMIDEQGVEFLLSVIDDMAKLNPRHVKFVDFGYDDILMRCDQVLINRASLRV
jgi:hypothetical protein